MKKTFEFKLSAFNLFQHVPTLQYYIIEKPFIDKYLCIEKSGKDESDETGMVKGIPMKIHEEKNIWWVNPEMLVDLKVNELKSVPVAFYLI